MAEPNGPRLGAGAGETRVVLADITALPVDAVVTAANERLAGGGGVDGAVHRAAGPDLLAACRALGGCPTGEARITPAFGLAVRHVIHAVGPIWRGGTAGEAALLASAYRAALSLADEVGARTLAFPALSTGVYGYPPAAAAPVAVGAVLDWLAATDQGIDQVLFACFGEESAALHRQALAVRGRAGERTVHSARR